MTLFEEIRNGKNAALESKEAGTSLDVEIGCVLSEIMEKLKGSVSRENMNESSPDKLPFGCAKTSAKEK